MTMTMTTTKLHAINALTCAKRVKWFHLRRSRQLAHVCQLTMQTLSFARDLACQTNFKMSDEGSMSDDYADTYDATSDKVNLTVPLLRIVRVL
jgi:hypothetical protein